MDGFCQIRCHSCNEVQRDRWAYRNHLLRVHREVIRTGTTTPVRLESRELATAWAADFNRLLECVWITGRRLDEYIKTGPGETAGPVRPFVLMMSAESGPPAVGWPVLHVPSVTPPRPPPPPQGLSGLTYWLAAIRSVTTPRPPSHTHRADCVSTAQVGGVQTCQRHRTNTLGFVPLAPPPSIAPLRLGPRLARSRQDPPSCGLKPCWSRGPLWTREARAQVAHRSTSSTKSRVTLS